MNTNIRRLAVASAIGAATLAPAGAAAAATSTAAASTSSVPSDSTSASSNNGQTWQQEHAQLEAALQARVTTLGDLTSSVASNKYLTSADRSALNSLLGPESSGIGSLLATVEAATPQNTTITQLRQYAKTMVGQYRVYLVMSRQVHLTEAATAQTSAELWISDNEAKIQQAIVNAGNPPTAVQAYNDLVTQVSNATVATGGADIPAVLQVTPSGYPGDGQPLTTASNALHQADTDLKAARGDLQIIRNALNQNDSGSKGSSATSSGADSSSS